MSEWASHLGSISDGYNSAAVSLQRLCTLASLEAANSPDNSAASRVFLDMSRLVLSSSNAVADALSGLGSMCEAMEMMKADPSLSSVTWGLVLNIMHVLSTQLSSHHSEVAEGVKNAKIQISSLQNATARSIGRTPTPSSLQPSVPSTPASRVQPSAMYPDEPHEEIENPAKKKKKKIRAEAEAAIIAPAVVANSSFASAVQPVEEPKKKKKKKKIVADSEQHSDGEASHPADTNPPAAAKLGASPQIAAPTSSSALFQRKPWDPDFFQVNGNINDSLGDLVNSSKPVDVFSAPETIIAGKKILHDYYILLDPPGRIGTLLVRCWVNVAPEHAQQFASDVLDLDDVTTERFSYVGKSIIADREDKLTGVPGCGWRCLTPTSSDSDPRQLYTMFICVDHPAEKMRRTLLIHDVVVIDKSKKEEVVTVITPTPVGKSETAKFAHVVVYAASVTKRRSTSAVSTETTLKYAPAIGTITKDLLEEYGYSEESADIVHEDDDDSVSMPVVDSTVVGKSISDHNFVDPTSLKSKEKKSVLGAVVGIGKTIALAPVTATMKVSSLVSGVAETAMLRQTDAKFQEWFPHLASESIIDTFNCALSEGALKQGVLYITKHWIAFSATVLSKRFSVSFDDVKDIRKAKFMKLFDNSIEVETYDGDVYFLTSFVSRDTAFSVLHGTWRNSGSQ